ncbi:hypothetical protein [Halarsenatibacter silvermanii]|uniref:Cupin domain-containing protein n=1 Tax=Halarsenatibacter silvermanii TaxID=321763 RepID=A0A1G9TJB9_9FIRM|nr:hypothetical protein [Halarsenatibacter silvermanii]SDM47846.1 hypothetical protein SAMN04488692_1412 [Halarsenatibacter silvermanii]
MRCDSVRKNLSQEGKIIEVTRVDEIGGKPNKRGVIAKKLHKNEDVQIMNLDLSPGDEVPRHSVPVNVFFYVVSGRGTIIIGKVCKKLI